MTKRSAVGVFLIALACGMGTAHMIFTRDAGTINGVDLIIVILAIAGLYVFNKGESS